MKCPDCGSDNCQRLEVVYQSGTFNIRAQSSGAGVGLSHGGIGGGVGTSETYGTSQTQLAAKAAPPEKMSYKFLFMLFIVGWVVVTVNSLDHWGWSLVGIGAMLGSFLMFLCLRLQPKTMAKHISAVVGIMDVPCVRENFSPVSNNGVKRWFLPGGKYC